MIAYLNGKYLPKDEITLSPDDRGFLFADGIYEVIRSYGGELFCMDQHLRRLSHGLSELKIGGVNPEEIGTISEELIRQNDLMEKDGIVYLQITRGVAPRLHRFPNPAVASTIYGFAKAFERTLEMFENGIETILVSDQRWARCDIKTVGLLPNALASQRAFEAEAFEALFVRDGMVLEGTHTSFFAVMNDRLIAPPLNNYILPSVTREVILRLCEETGIEVEIRALHESSIPDLQEAMIAGTTTEVTPVISIEGKPVGSGKAGPITRRLQKAFAELIDR